MVEYDPFSMALIQDPYPIYQQLRDELPVFRNEDLNFWAVSRYSDVAAIARDPETYSSETGGMIGGIADLLPPNMSMADDPDHARMRRAHGDLFSPRGIRRLEEQARKTTKELIDRLNPADIELVDGLSSPLPVAVMADLLSVPEADRWMFRACADQFTHMNPHDEASMQQAKRAMEQFVPIFDSLMERRRKEPADDLITSLVAAVDAGVLSYSEYIGSAVLMVIAGTETAANLIGNSVMVLTSRADDRQRLQDDLSLLPGAIEEVLRYESPVQGLIRTTTREVELHGETLPVGAQVLSLYGSANRDERKFAEPDVFDMKRDNRGSVAFGHGIHTCIGNHLARLEARVALEELLARFSDWNVNSLELLQSAPVRGPKTLRMEFA